MTIQTKVSQLSSREASMLLMVCNVQALSQGIDISMYLAMEFLYAYLTKSGSVNPEDLKDERIRQTCLLTHIILGAFRGNWTNLLDREQILDRKVHEAVINSGWLPDKRTFNSWLQHWDIAKWLEVRIVPLNYLLDRSSYSEPYSGYCKGYGEGGHRTRVSTPYSSELDGEEYSEPTPPEFNLLEAEAYRTILLALERQRTKVQQRKQ